MNPTMQTILARRSVRAYQPKPVPEEDLKAILEAGSFAPSAMGQQSWRLTAVQSPEARKKVNATLRQVFGAMQLPPDANPILARLVQMAADENAEYLYGAPVVVIVSNVRENSLVAADSALAIGNMLLAAKSLGLGSCWVNHLAGMTDQPPVRVLMEGFGIPANHNIYGACVLGYAAQEPDPAPRKDVIRIV